MESRHPAEANSAHSEESPLRIHVRRQTECVTISAIGEIDCLCVDQLGRALLGELQKAGHAVVVADLTGTRYIDSSGIRLLHQAAVVADSPTRFVVYTRPGSAVEKSLRICGIDKRATVKTVCADHKEA
ncbi:MAG: STAS domain-containing protein [Armatimonadota bacterium]